LIAIGCMFLRYCCFICCSHCLFFFLKLKEVYYWPPCKKKLRRVGVVGCGNCITVSSKFCNVRVSSFHPKRTGQAQCLSLTQSPTCILNLSTLISFILKP
jgi:hypothetical protein